MKFHYETFEGVGTEAPKEGTKESDVWYEFITFSHLHTSIELEFVCFLWSGRRIRPRSNVYRIRQHQHQAHQCDLMDGARM